MSPEQLPNTLTIGKGVSMTFLKNDKYIMKTHITGAPDADILEVPLHWHETHDEIFIVSKGRVEVRIGSSIRLYGPEDGEVRVPKRVEHSLKSRKGEECIIYERTEPMDDQKELFFRNAFWRGTMPTDLFEAMLIFYHGDGRPVFLGNFRWLEKLFVTVVGGYIAPMLGYTRKYESLKKL